MNNQLMQRVIAEVVARLEARASKTAELSVAQLREAPVARLICDNATLHIAQADLPFLSALAGSETSDTGALNVHQALAAGMTVQITLFSALLPALPLKKLARLPVCWRDEHQRVVYLHAARLLSYRDVAHIENGWLVIRRDSVVTTMAREAAATRHLRLVKQG